MHGPAVATTASMGPKISGRWATSSFEARLRLRLRRAPQDDVDEGAARRMDALSSSHVTSRPRGMTIIVTVNAITAAQVNLTTVILRRERSEPRRMHGPAVATTASMGPKISGRWATSSFEARLRLRLRRAPQDDVDEGAARRMDALSSSHVTSRPRGMTIIVRVNAITAAQVNLTTVILRCERSEPRRMHGPAVATTASMR